MSRPSHQGFVPLSYFPPPPVDSFGIPLLFSHALEESDSGGGGGPYGQPAHPGLADAYGHSGDAYPQQHSRQQQSQQRPRGHRQGVSADHVHDTYDFSGLPTTIGYEQSHAPVDIYAQGARQPQVYYPSEDRTNWDTHAHAQHRGPGEFSGQPGTYRRSGGRNAQEMPPQQHSRHGPPPFDVHGGRNIYTNPARSPYPPSSIDPHSYGNPASIIKSDSPAIIPLTLPTGESTYHQPIDAWLRQNLDLRSNQPINLWSLPDPAPRDARPNVTYKLLVSLAIYGSPHGRLSLQEIYAHIEDRFPYYRNLPEEPGRDGKGGGKKWQRSVRHNLSLESIFVNDGRPIAEPGKGGYWTLTNRNGYGQKRERKRKGKNSSRESLTSIKAEDDDELEDEEDDDQSFEDVRPGSSSGHRRSTRHANTSTTPFPPGLIIGSGRQETNTGPVLLTSAPTFGQPSLGPRSRPGPARTPSMPLMSSMPEPPQQQYPARPSTVPAFGAQSYNPMAPPVQQPHRHEEHSYYYGTEVDEDARRMALRGDKGKRRQY